jgi:hypothetical protein
MRIAPCFRWTLRRNSELRPLKSNSGLELPRGRILLKRFLKTQTFALLLVGFGFGPPQTLGHLPKQKGV